MSSVIAVSASAAHSFSKMPQASIELIAGLGVAGDAHAGVTVKHRSRVAIDPHQPNLRQVHLLHAEVFDDPAVAPFALAPGEIGENITTRGLALLDLPTGTRLHIGATAIVELTGLRNPCVQLDTHRRGLTKAMIEKRLSGEIMRKSGVMAIVIAGGLVMPGDGIAVTLPPLPHRPMERV